VQHLLSMVHQADKQSNHQEQKKVIQNLPDLTDDESR
jgi:hypothetical protein